MGASGRTLVIGDVHGCRDEAEDLLARCDHTPDDDVVFVGDLVAKGPDSAGVIDLCLRIGARSVLGNHDAAVLDHLHAKAAGVPNPYLKPSHKPVIESLEPHHVAYLESLPLWIALPEHNALVVHAGLVPGVAVADQERALLLNIRTLRADGTGSKVAEDGVLWGTRWLGPELVIFGHHALAGLQQHPFALGLDTGCAYGRELTAFVLPQRTIVSVPARRAYAPIKLRGSTPPDAPPIAPVEAAAFAHVPLSSLVPGQAVVVRMSPDAGGRPREALLLLDHDGTPRAYINRCEHLPIPIDGGSRHFFTSDKSALLCGTHGARFRLDSGYCFRGPCRGRSLIALDLRIEEGIVELRER
jgi:nitrite reductase/ring-hydroxylating ferredoxin subunit